MMLIDYLRMGQVAPSIQDPYELQMFEEELKYWAFDSKEMQKKKHFFSELQIRVFDIVPTNLDHVIMNRWNQLGVFDVTKYLGELDENEIDMSMPISVNQRYGNSVKSGQLNEDQRLVGIGRKEGLSYIFEGLWDKDFKPIFLRSIEKADGSYYIGHYKNYERHGLGKFVSADGTT